QTQVIDGTGKFLIPALWDMHIHLTNEPSQAVTREWMMPLLLAYGVTGIREMGGDWQRIQQLQIDLLAGKLKGPHIIAAGPFVDGPGFVDKPVTTPDEARQRVKELKALGVAFIKVQANLVPDVYQAVLAEAAKQKLVVAGHIPEAISAFVVAQSNQRSIEHLSPILPGDAGILLACSNKEAALRADMLALKNFKGQELRQRERSLETQLIETYDAKKCAGLFRLLAKKQIFVTPTQIWAERLLPLNAQDLLDATALSLMPRTQAEKLTARRTQRIATMPPENFVLLQRVADIAQTLVTQLHRARVPLLAGTDALDGDVIPGLSLHQELERFVRAGLTPLEALQTTTRNAARYFGTLAESGTIERGKRADLLLLDADPLRDIHNTQKIHAIIHNGKLIDATQRAALLKAVAAFAETH
ncbi:MAG: amidohydrolase family protein, partial [Acidobacteria bacterium]|nr:amidohydrolase family protein [Acidobacteriota bacterium]